jgi:hypothetical protein
MGDKYGLMDTIAELRSHLAKVNKEIERRTKLVEGPLKSCCDGCTDGGDCDGGCH